MYHGLVNIFDLHATFSYLRSHNHIPMLFKVPMKHIFFFRSYKILPSGVKIADFTSIRSWTTLPSKMVLESRSQNAA